MLKKDKAMKTTVAMLAALSMVSSLAFAAVAPNGAGDAKDGVSFHVENQGSDKYQENTEFNAANGKDPVKLGSDHPASLNVIAANKGYNQGANVHDATGNTPVDGRGNKIDATTGASILVTDDVSSVQNAHNTDPNNPNDPDKYNVDTHKAKVVVTGERTEMGLAAFGGPTGTAMGAWTVANGTYASAFGDTAKATGAHATALGSASLAAADDSFAAGWGSVVEKGADGGVAIGKNATVKAGAADGVAIGAGSVATKAGEVSLGNTSTGVYNKMSNLGDATLSATSRDAVTGRQLYQTNQEVDRVGALSAALAGLHPLDYNGTGSKFSLATAVGNYDGQKALALGGFYNFSPDAMMTVGVSTSFGGDRKSAENLGFSFRVGEGASTTATPSDEMVQRFNNLEQAVAQLKAQNQALAQNMAAVEQENKDLKAKVDTLQK